MPIAEATEPLHTVVQVEVDCRRQHGHEEGSDGCTHQSISTVHCKPKEDRTILMARHDAVETEDTKRQEEEWKDYLEIVLTFERLKPQV